MNGVLRRAMVIAVVVMIAWSVQAQGGTAVANNTSQAVCAGRLFVNLPNGAKVSIGGRFKGIETKQPVYAANFDVVKRLVESKADRERGIKTDRDPRLDAISRRFGSDPAKDRARTNLIGMNTDDKNKEISLGYHTDEVTFKFTAELHRYLDQHDYEFTSVGYDAPKYPDARKRLIETASRFEPINNRSIPTKPGFCIDGGMFVDAGKPPVNERFTLVVTFPDHPDVQFSIDANAIDQVNKDEPSLKHRVDDDLKMMRANYSGGVSVLERGEKTVAGQEGYQVAVSAPYDVVPGTRIRKFFWSADGVPNDVTRPFMEVDLTIQPTDDGKSTIKDDAEAKALWDTLIRSIRIRPGAV